MSEKVILPVEVINAVLSYLQTKPYIETYKIIDALLKAEKLEEDKELKPE